MKKITRRRAIIQIGGLAGGSALLPGCCCLRRLIGHPCDPFDDWHKAGEEWWKDRLRERERQRERERENGQRPDVELPHPYLYCGKERSSRGWIGDQLRQLELNEWGEMAFIIDNRGNAPSWTCFAEAYEGPFAVYGLRYSELRLVGRTVVSVQAGQKVEAVVPWQATRPVNGSISLRCFDPVWDPGLLTFEQYERTNTGGSWREYRFE